MQTLIIYMYLKASIQTLIIYMYLKASIQTLIIYMYLKRTTHHLKVPHIIVVFNNLKSNHANVNYLYIFKSTTRNYTFTISLKNNKCHHYNAAV